MSVQFDPTRPATTELVAGGAAAVQQMVIRVAGLVPARVDLQNAGTPEQQLGLTLGAVLVYMQTGFTARTVEQQWAQAAPLAASLVPVLTGPRFGVMATGPWSATALVRLNGTPKLSTALLKPQAGVQTPAILRIAVGPMGWEICDGAAFAAMVNGWRTAARLLSGDNSREE